MLVLCYQTHDEKTGRFSALEQIAGICIGMNCCKMEAVLWVHAVRNVYPSTGRESLINNSIGFCHSFPFISSCENSSDSHLLPIHFSSKNITQHSQISWKVSCGIIGPCSNIYSTPTISSVKVHCPKPQSCDDFLNWKWENKHSL